MEGKLNSVIERRCHQVGQQSYHLGNSAQKYKAEELCWNSVGQIQKKSILNPEKTNNSDA